MLSNFLLNSGNELWGKKWRKTIMWKLKEKPLRFSELKRNMTDCSVKMLSEALDDMENDGLLIRKQYDGIPVKVTYELTEDVQEIVDNMENYINLLSKFFYKHRVRYNVPTNIVEQLEKDLLSNK
jgi:DNA-binding HxlR family transcriptional regulator